MVNLLHHIKPWMWKLIVDSEERVETKMEMKTDQKFQMVHEHLDSFELRVLERTTLTTGMSSFQTELASLQGDVDAILDTPAIEPQVSLSILGNNTVLGVLFSRDDVEEQPEPSRARGKMH